MSDWTRFLEMLSNLLYDVWIALHTSGLTPNPIAPRQNQENSNDEDSFSGEDCFSVKKARKMPSIRAK
jgi:hypothetical protein